jgi:AraC-like DNA-binding protein
MLVVRQAPAGRRGDRALPSSWVTTFDDPDRYQAMLRGADCEVLLHHGGSFKVELTRVDLDRLWMQRGRCYAAPPIVRAALDPSRVAVLFASDTDHGPMHHNGIDLSSSEIVLHRRGDTIYNWAQGPTHWAAMSLTHDDFAKASQALLGHALEAPSRTYVAHPASEAMRQLRTLHNATCQLAGTTPSAFSCPATVTALEQELVRALVACVAGPGLATAKIEKGRRSSIVGRFHDFLASRPYEPVYVGEICAAIGVSEGTLRNCCHERLGMGPIHYLWLRRMHLARRTLLDTDGTAKTVTEVATEHGFWELGRFSVEYRALFGESPSATLRRPPEATSRSKTR